jgi:hypothetical protein
MTHDQAEEQEIMSVLRDCRELDEELSRGER